MLDSCVLKIEHFIIQRQYFLALPFEKVVRNH